MEQSPNPNAQRYIIMASIGVAVIGTAIMSLSGAKQVSVTSKGGSKPAAAQTMSVVALHTIKKGSGVNWGDVGVLETSQVVRSYPDFAKEAGKLKFNQTTKRVGVAKRNLKTGEPLYSKTVSFDKGVLTKKK